MDDNKIFQLNCDCNDIGLHDVKIQVDEDSVMIYTSMKHYIPWYKRLFVAVKYVLGIDNTYVDYQETFMFHKDFLTKMSEIMDYVKSLDNTLDKK